MNKEMEEYDSMDKKSSLKKDFFESFPDLPHFHLFMRFIFIVCWHSALCKLATNFCSTLLTWCPHICADLVQVAFVIFGWKYDICTPWKFFMAICLMPLATSMLIYHFMIERDKGRLWNKTYLFCSSVAALVDKRFNEIGCWNKDLNQVFFHVITMDYENLKSRADLDRSQELVELALRIRLKKIYIHLIRFLGIIQSNAAYLEARISSTHWGRTSLGLWNNFTLITHNFSMWLKMCWYFEIGVGSCQAYSECYWELNFQKVPWVNCSY